MKKLLFIISLFICDYAQAGIYINNNIKPYIGINFGFNILDYTINTELDNKYTSATINAGTRIGNNFGAELFFSHSAKNSIQYITDLDTLDHEIYYQSFGFDLFGYYKISKEFDFFTTFGFIEVDPELWLCHEYEFSFLPRTMLTPEVSESAECTPAFRKLDSPYTCNLEVVHLASAKSIYRSWNCLIHSRDRPCLCKILGVTGICKTTEK